MTRRGPGGRGHRRGRSVTPPPAPPTPITALGEAPAREMSCATHEGPRRLVLGDRIEQWGLVLPQRWDVCPACVVRLTSGGGHALIGATVHGRPILAAQGSRVVLRVADEEIDVTDAFVGRS